MIFNKKKKIEFNSKALLTLELILNELYQATYLENKNTFKNTSGTLNETILDYKKYKNEKLGLYTVESIKAILSDCNNIIKDLDKKKVYWPYQEQYTFAKQEFLSFIKEYKELT